MWEYGYSMTGHQFHVNWLVSVTYVGSGSDDYTFNVNKNINVFYVVFILNGFQ